MSSILLITSSPRGSASHSTRVATELALKLQAKKPGAKITTRDLANNPLPHIDADYATGIYTPAESRSTQQQSVVGVSDALVDELLAADAIVIATGLINFNISSTLKAWIDHIARAGKTFSYGADGPKGLVTGKKVYLVIASGGVYSSGPAASFDHATPYLKATLGFLGMTDVEVIRIEGVAMGPEAEEKAVTSALNLTGNLALAA
ncbi:FMN-dependent NADH-azoreductase [Phyllobacterium endophyticum]|jgi:FMN-dependent NADH-azoreductase|uniref:FMN dependent NADH:quinone oxidoreductase n=1 Tax=Phyllobacterium endophyticum TaxID=1149773 RepID=A0A2P7B0S9_9HYPH|nr:FMN-dependent NADH-azoreductase [Phyllobacterium endophyticum]MBB3237619.1 FMN-dependent NADH-azoreductase [Phyllobacterium endophyticum]PSH60086.1 FMN-dependent NADH-azoreductase [Phyllobacterium endophyticum]TYR42253.1 FMN-dependent NADH-azoreductase [Phyllobacterium endophyticum]